MMNRETIEARANAKAHALHTHVMAVPGRPGVYTVTSASEPGVKHFLVVRDGDVAGCDCRGWQYRQSCRHAEAARNRLAREAVAARRQRPANISDLYPAA